MNARDWMDQQASMLANRIEAVIEKADEAGVALDNGNIIDLLADNITDESLETLRATLGHTSHSIRFMDAIKRNRGRV